MATFTKSQKEEILKQAKLFWSQAEKAHSQHYLNITDWERMARCLLPQDILDAFSEQTGRSCIAPPDFFVNIESLKAAIHGLVFGRKPYGLLSVYGDKNWQNPAIKKAEQILQFQNDLGDTEHKSGLAVAQALITGMGASKTAWRRKIVRVPLRVDGELVTDSNKNPQFSEEVVASFAEDVPIDMRRVRIDPSCDRIQDRRIVGHHRIGQLSNLIMLNRNPGHFYEFDEEELRKSSFNYEKYYEYVHGEVDALGEKGKQNDGFGDKIIEIREVNGIFRITDVNEIVYVDLIVHYANDDILLGAKLNDIPIPSYLMYDFPTVDDDISRLFPMGVVEPAQDMWIYLFRLMNNILDRSNRDTYDMYIGDKAALQGLEENISFEDGKILKVDTLAAALPNAQAALSPIHRGNTSETPFRLMVAVQNMIQQIMKLSDYIQGADPTRAETATAVEALVQGGQSLLLHLVARLVQSYYKPAWQKKLILWNFFNGHTRTKIHDEKGQLMEILPGEIDLYWNVDVDVKGNRDRPSIIRRFVEMLPLIKSSPNFDQYQVDKTIMKVLELPNGDKLMTNYNVLQMTIDKENAALAEGVQQPVHPAEDHMAHKEGHEEFRDNAGLTSEQIRNVDEHIQQHLAELEKQNKGLGNTKELGGNSGQQISPGMPSTKNRSGSGYGLKNSART